MRYKHLHHLHALLQIANYTYFISAKKLTIKFHSKSLIITLKNLKILLVRLFFKVNQQSWLRFSGQSNPKVLKKQLFTHQIHSQNEMDVNGIQILQSLYDLKNSQSSQYNHCSFALNKSFWSFIISISISMLHINDKVLFT